MSGVPDAFAGFRTAVEAAVTRGRRAADAAGAGVAAQRAANRALADRAKAGRVSPREGHEATSADVRRVAAGFRGHRGLPVGQLPSGTELLSAEESQVRTDANANSTPPAPVGGSRAPIGPSGQLPPETGDDEDFSQARILY
ncbi:hypothetical protein [Actinosynnema sp. NPDC020468]|uniref:hypothetical protein n=1 Tax=Actinosynnema sp. NPDC020468 TaxID=3154488 RepID=UPI0033F281B4